MSLNRDQILQAKDDQRETLDVPEWGGQVNLKVLTSAERDEYESKMVDLTNGNRPKNFRAGFAATCICDDAGKRIFSEGDIEELGKKNGSVMNKIFNKILEMNKYTEADVKELEGN